jgi:hypothetical protein
MFFSYTRESQSKKSRDMCYIKYNTKKDKQDRKVKYGKTTAKLVVKSIFSESFWCHFSILVKSFKWIMWLWYAMVLVGCLDYLDADSAPAQASRHLQVTGLAVRMI